MLWVIFIGLIVIALAPVLWPLYRPAGGGAARASYDAEIFRDQLKEIEADRERGLIGKAEAEAAKTEISRRLLALSDKGGELPTGKAGKKSSTVLGFSHAALLVTVLVPLVAFGFYYQYGSPESPDLPRSARFKKTPEEIKIDRLIAQVEERLRKFPKEARGWEVLAPVYVRRRRYTDAINAYEKALQLSGESGDLLAGYGDAIIFSNQGQVTEQAREVLRQAIKLDNSLAKPRFWLALALEQDGKLTKAVAAYRALLKRAGPQAPWRLTVESRLKNAMRQAGIKPPEVTEKPDAGARVSALDDGQPGPSSEDVEAAGKMSSSDRQAMIKGMVNRLAVRLKEEGGDLTGWLRLLRAYAVLGERDKAAKALKDARTNFTGKAQALRQLDSLAKQLGLGS